MFKHPNLFIFWLQLTLFLGVLNTVWTKIIQDPSSHKRWIRNKCFICVNQKKKCMIFTKEGKLTFILLMWRIRWAPSNTSKWQMEFNLAFKGLIYCGFTRYGLWINKSSDYLKGLELTAAWRMWRLQRSFQEFTTVSVTVTCDVTFLHCFLWLEGYVEQR